MKKLRIAIVGCKNMGRKHLCCLQEHFSAEVKIAGILNSTVKSSAKCGQELGVPYFEKLTDINRRRVDAVIIATPAETHYEVAKELIAKKIPLLIEKPFAETEEQCYELRALAREKHVPLLIGHTENYNPAVVKLREVLEAPIRTIAAFRSSNNPGFKRTHIISELMIHDISIVNSLTSAAVKKVSVSKKGEYRWDEHAVVEMLLEDGSAVRLEALRAECPVERRMRIIDKDSHIYQIDFLERRLRKDGETLCEGGDSLAAELRDFIEMCKGGRPLVSVDEGVENVEICRYLESFCQN